MNDHRKHQVRLLLSTLWDDHSEPGLPGVQPSRTFRESQSGFGPTGKHPCTICNNTGRVWRSQIDLYGKRTFCPECDGTGWRLKRSGEQDYDPYSNEVAPLSELEEPVTEEPRRPKRTNPLSEYPWERKDRLGSYKALRALLGALQDVDVVAHRAIYWTYCWTGWESSGLEKDEDRAVTWIAQRMPDNIKVPYWVLREENMNTTPDIEEMRRRGYGKKKIERLLGMRGDKKKRVRDK